MYLNYQQQQQKGNIYSTSTLCLGQSRRDMWCVLCDSRCCGNSYRSYDTVWGKQSKRKPWAEGSSTSAINTTGAILLANQVIVQIALVTFASRSFSHKSTKVKLVLLVLSLFNFAAVTIYGFNNFSHSTWEMFLYPKVNSFRSTNL